MLSDKAYDKHTQHEIDKQHLKMIREDQVELMEQINRLDRLEKNLIYMMGGE